MRGQAATTAPQKSYTGLVIAVVSVGAVLLLGLIGGTIFLSLSGTESPSDDSESTDSKQVASGDSKPSTEEKPQADAPVPNAGDDGGDSRTINNSAQPDSTYQDNGGTPSDHNAENHTNYSAPSPPNAPIPPLQQDPLPVSRSENSDRYQSDVAIRLFRGVALPQTLPEGTAIGFSVNYEFSKGTPRGSNKFLWVISNGQEQTVPIAVPLDHDGQLQAFIGWQPRQAPFTCHIEEVTPQGKRRMISQSLRFP